MYIYVVLDNTLVSVAQQVAIKFQGYDITYINAVFTVGLQIKYPHHETRCSLKNKGILLGMRVTMKIY